MVVRLHELTILPKHGRLQFVYRVCQHLPDGNPKFKGIRRKDWSPPDLLPVQLCMCLVSKALK